jgi:hypothetical protein
MPIWTVHVPGGSHGLRASQSFWVSEHLQAARLHELVEKAMFSWLLAVATSVALSSEGAAV